jgi:hypothetical protein
MILAGLSGSFAPCPVSALAADLSPKPKVLEAS